MRPFFVTFKFHTNSFIACGVSSYISFKGFAIFFRHTLVRSIFGIYFNRFTFNLWHVFSNSVLPSRHAHLHLYIKQILQIWSYCRVLFLGWPSRGKQQPVDVLCGFVYAAARFGVESFIRMVFGTSAGRIIFARYSNKSPLPEELADRNGQNEIAAYLRSVKKRYWIIISGWVYGWGSMKNILHFIMSFSRLHKNSSFRKGRG